MAAIRASWDWERLLRLQLAMPPTLTMPTPWILAHIQGCSEAAWWL